MRNAIRQAQVIPFAPKNKMKNPARIGAGCDGKWGAKLPAKSSVPAAMDRWL
jgi:hypothetical protein